MDAASYLVLTSSASKRTLFPSNDKDKENESDDSLGHMSPLDSSPDRYSSPTHSAHMSSPMTATPSPLRPLNTLQFDRLSRHGVWQLKNYYTPTKSPKNGELRRSPRIAQAASQIPDDTSKSELVDETPAKDISQNKILMSPFGYLTNKTDEMIKHIVQETPESSSVRKTIFTPLKDTRKRNNDSSEPDSDVKRPTINVSGISSLSEISKKTFYKSSSKARASLFSEKMSARIPIAKKRTRSPSAASVKSRTGSWGRALKRRRAGEINLGVFHKIKRPKHKPEQIKVPKVTPQDRVEDYLAKKVNEIPRHDTTTMDIEQPVPSSETPQRKSDPAENLVHSPPADPAKKFFKTNRTLAINRKATISFVDKMKIQVTNGKILLNSSEQNPKSRKTSSHQKKDDDSKKTDSGFEDMVVEPLPESVNESVQSILESLQDDIPNKFPASFSQESVDSQDKSAPSQLVESELQTTSVESIVAITASTSSLVLDEGGKESQDAAEGRNLFPIFYKDQSQKTKPLTPSKKSPRSSKIMKYVGTGPDQYILDAGQKRFGAITCKECGVVYNAGDAEDEQSHYNLHHNIQSLRFMGWQKEHVVHSYTDGRVIVIKPNDSKRKLNKVKEVLDVVDRELGVVDPDRKHLDTSKVYLFVNNKSVVGCLVAQPMKEAYKMLTVGTDSIDCCSTESYPVKCGVSRIWTAKDYRKSQIATRLMDCLRLSFVHGSILNKEEIAFSVPTLDGKAFAVKYTGTRNFLVYN